MLKTIFVPIHPAGWPFISLFAGITALITWFMPPLGVLALLLTAWCVYFFRDPPRITPDRKGLLISPADGIIQSIVQAPPPPRVSAAPHSARHSA